MLNIYIQIQNKRSYFLTSRRLSPNPSHNLPTMKNCPYNKNNTQPFQNQTNKKRTGKKKASFKAHNNKKAYKKKDNNNKNNNNNNTNKKQTKKQKK